MAIFNDITLGQYYPAESFVHRLDPRTKIIAIMLLMTSLLVTFNFVLITVFVVLSILIVVMSKVPVALILKNLRPFLWLFAITMLIHLLWTTGRIMATIPVLQIEITYEGLHMGLIYVFRLILLIISAATLTLTTSPIELTDALEKMSQPLRRFRVPTHEITMMLTLSLRFIPTLLEEAQRIKNAQLSRGANFEGSLINRMKGLIPLVLPLFVSAFRRADELALAMDARCYAGGEGRSSFNRLRFRVYDVVIIAGSLLLFLVTVWID